MSRSDFGKRDIRSRAFFTGVVASGRKAASRFGVNGIANLSTNHCGSSMTLGKIRDGDGRKKGLCIWVQWVAEQFIGGRPLYTLTQIHDCDLIRNMLDHTEVMRYEDICQPFILFQIHQNIQNLSLDRHIQSRYWLVADDKPRIQGQSPRNSDSLTASAIQLMRIRVSQAR